MDIKKHWPTIQSVFQNGQSSSKHCSIATVNADGSPHITPIGSLFLRDNCTGYYFEKFTEGMPDNFKHNQRICILAINSDTKYWLKSLFGGRFSSPPEYDFMGVLDCAVWEQIRKSILFKTGCVKHIDSEVIKLCGRI